jgi:signal transduction histidine kinase
VTRRFAPRLSVRLRATLAATAIVAIALGVSSAALVGVLQGSLEDSAADEAARRAAITADLLAAASRQVTVRTGEPGSPGPAVDAVDPDVVIIGEKAVAPGNVLVVPKPWAPSGTYAVATQPVDTAVGKVLVHAVGRHRRFVADAAHELRSPLAVLRTRLEIAPPQALTTEALLDVDRIQRLTTDLLLLARLDADEPPEHEEVDNAVRHAETAVLVRLVRQDGDAVLEVDDDGPGIPVEHREAVFDRFTRLDEARDRDAGGSGLGLAIVRDVAARHGGSVAVVGGPPGAQLRARVPIR